MKFVHENIENIYSKLLFIFVKAQAKKNKKQINTNRIKNDFIINLQLLT